MLCVNLVKTQSEYFFLAGSSGAWGTHHAPRSRPQFHCSRWRPDATRRRTAQDLASYARRDRLGHRLSIAPVRKDGHQNTASATTQAHTANLDNVLDVTPRGWKIDIYPSSLVCFLAEDTLLERVVGALTGLPGQGFSLPILSRSCLAWTGTTYHTSSIFFCYTVPWEISDPFPE